jgi:hypothetical protein
VDIGERVGAVIVTEPVTVFKVAMALSDADVAETGSCELPISEGGTMGSLPTKAQTSSNLKYHKTLEEGRRQLDPQQNNWIEHNCQ